MKVGDLVTATVTGTLVKIELYADNKTRYCVQDVPSNQYAIVAEEGVKNVTITAV